MRKENIEQLYLSNLSRSTYLVLEQAFETNLTAKKFQTF